MANSLTLSHINFPAPSSSIDAYLQRVSQIPVLTVEQEQELAERWYQSGDTQAAKTLVISHLRFVAHIARTYSGYGLALADLIQEGNIGLMKAVKRFNPTMGVRLISFAVHWIKAEMNDYVIRNWRIVRIATTKAQRKLFFKLRSAKKRLGWFNDEEIQHVAKELKVSTKEIREMENRLQAQDLAFDAHEDNEEENHSISPCHYLTDTQGDPAHQLENWQANQNQQMALRHAWNKLTDREQDIMQRRWLQQEKATLQELAAEYNVSAERVRQIEQGALKKLQQEL